MHIYNLSSRLEVDQTYQLIISQLQGAKQSANGGVIACCPNPTHNDSRPSFHIEQAMDGTILGRCYRGCTVEEWTSGVGVRPAELFPYNHDHSAGGGKSPRQPAKPGQHHASTSTESGRADLLAIIKAASWPALACQFTELSKKLQLPEQAVRTAFPSLRMTKAFGAIGWYFPEMDGEGGQVGAGVRFLDGSKKSYGHRGITVTPEWDTLDSGGPVFLVEGVSDVIALTAIGRNVLGRPSNTGGKAALIAQLAGIPADRPIIVVGERDQKPDGSWPGREGAEQTAQHIAEARSCPVLIAFPPGDAKDSRAYVTASIASGQSLTAIGDEFRAHCQTNHEVITPVPTETPQQAVASITQDVAKYVVPYDAMPTECFIPCVTDEPPLADPANLECERKTPVLMRSRFVKRKYAKFDFDCRSLSCPACRGKRIRQYKESARIHLIEHAHSHDDACPLAVYEVSIDQWNAQAKRIRQKRANFIRLDINHPDEIDPTYLVVSTIPPSSASGIHFNLVTPEVAIDRLVAKLESPPAAKISRKAYFSSRPWKLIQEESPHTGQWERVGKANCTAEFIEETLERNGCQPAVYRVGSGRWWSWKCHVFSLAELSNDDAIHVLAELTEGELLPRWRARPIEDDDADPTACSGAIETPFNVNLSNL